MYISLIYVQVGRRRYNEYIRWIEANYFGEVNLS